LSDMEWRLASRELAAALGHTINNPLTAIANYLEILERSSTAGTDALPLDMLTSARGEVGRIAEIVRRLVNLRDPKRIATALGANMTDLGGNA